MTLEQVKEHFKNAEEVIDYDGGVLKISDIYNLDIYNHFGNWFTNISDDNCVCLYSTHSGFAQITKYKKMKNTTEVSNEFILKAHQAADREWAAQIEKDFPELFPKLELEVGKWYYNDEGSKYLICYKGDDKCYGFFDGEYGYSWVFDITDKPETRPATDEEVEKALIDEAERRGFKEGVKVKKLSGISVVLLDDSGYFHIYDNSLCVGSWEVFKDGKWATIIQPEKEIEHNGHTYVLKD